MAYNDFMCERNPKGGDHQLVPRAQVASNIDPATGAQVIRNDKFVAQGKLEGQWKNLHFGETLEECITYLKAFSAGKGYTVDTRIKDDKGVIL